MESQPKTSGLSKSKSSQSFSFSKLFKFSKKSQSERSLKKHHKESSLSKETEFKREEPMSPEEMVDLEIFSILNGTPEHVEMMFDIDGEETVVDERVFNYY